MAATRMAPGRVHCVAGLDPPAAYGLAPQDCRKRLAARLRAVHGERFVPSVLWRFFERHDVAFKQTAHASEQARPDVVAARSLAGPAV